MLQERTTHLRASKRSKTCWQRTRKKTDELRTKLEQAQRDADLALLLADLASVMREVDTRNFSEGKRVRFNAVRQRLDAARAA